MECGDIILPKSALTRYIMYGNIMSEKMSITKEH